MYVYKIKEHLTYKFWLQEYQFQVLPIHIFKSHMCACVYILTYIRSSISITNYYQVVYQQRISNLYSIKTFEEFINGFTLGRNIEKSTYLISLIIKSFLITLIIWNCYIYIYMKEEWTLTLKRKEKNKINMSFTLI